MGHHQARGTRSRSSRASVSLRTESRSRWSSPEKGSSISMTWGRGTTARASATRCARPPRGDADRTRHRPRARRAQRMKGNTLCLLRGRLRSPKATFSMIRQMREQGEVLEHQSDVALLGRHEAAGTRHLGPIEQHAATAGPLDSAAMRSKVVLPQPEGPSRQAISPA